MKISKKWNKMKDVYMLFSSNLIGCDFSDDAALEMFKHESHGNKISRSNGFYWAKHNMDLTISMWKEDIAVKNLSINELYEDDFPHWWLDKIFK